MTVFPISNRIEVNQKIKRDNFAYVSVISIVSFDPIASRLLTIQFIYNIFVHYRHTICIIERARFYPKSQQSRSTEYNVHRHTTNINALLCI